MLFELLDINLLYSLARPPSGNHPLVAMVKIVEALKAISSAFGLEDSCERDEMVFPAMDITHLRLSSAQVLLNPTAG